MADIAVLAIVAVYSAFIVCRIVRKRKKGGGCAGCASGSCAGYHGCSSAYIDSLIKSAADRKE